MINKLVPRQPDPRIKKASDQEIAKFGHLNWLIEQINLVPPGSGITSVVGGTDITIDNTDPLNPVINFTGSGGGENLAQTLTIGKNATLQDIDNLNQLQVKTINDTVANPGISIITNGSTGAGDIDIIGYASGNSDVNIAGNTVNLGSNTGFNVIVGGNATTGAFIMAGIVPLRCNSTGIQFPGSGGFQSSISEVASNVIDVNVENSKSVSFVPGALKLVVYADTATRDAAITVPALGMIIAITNNGLGSEAIQGYISGSWKDL